MNRKRGRTSSSSSFTSSSSLFALEAVTQWLCQVFKENLLLDQARITLCIELGWMDLRFVETFLANKDKEIGLMRNSNSFLWAKKMNTLPSPVNLVPFCCNHQPTVSNCPAPNSTILQTNDSHMPVQAVLSLRAKSKASVR
jgi:hypothetical protein